MITQVLALADSRLPIGGHVHSGGFEEAVASGIVRDMPTLEALLRRRIRTSGLVGASVAVAVRHGLDVAAADVETDARTPSPAARAASRAQGRGLLRLAKHVWPQPDWQAMGPRPHLPVIFGAVAAHIGTPASELAAVYVYTTMTGAATAAQRLLALDPADVAACTLRLSALCDDIAAAATKGLAGLSDPLLDSLAERHAQRPQPLFAS